MEALQLIKQGGKVTSIAGVPDEETAAMMGMTDYQLPDDLARLINEKSANYKLTWMQPNGEQLNEISALVKAGTIQPVIDKVYAFREGIEAYEYLATGRAKGKVIISLS